MILQVHTTVPRIEELKIKVKRRLRTTDHPTEFLNCIDTLQRLGISYHFVQEIEDKLQSIRKDGRRRGSLMTATDQNNRRWPDGTDDDLYTVALQFRLFRQNGHRTSSDVFNRFKNSSGRFRAELSADTKGLLSLYEASQFALPIERTSDEAKEFALNRLEASLLSSNYVLENCDRQRENQIIKHAIMQPLRTTLPRMVSRHYLDCRCLHATNHQEDCELIELGTAEFNHLQSMHQNDLEEFTRWWNELGIWQEFGLLRNQPSMWFLLSALAVPEAEFCECRIELSKLTALVFVVDDLFDVYGAFQDLLAFTHAIHSWDPAYAERLPMYMRSCYLALLTLSNNLARRVLEEHGCNVVPHLKHMWSCLLDAFWKEWRWLRAKEVPLTKEYLENATITSGLPVFLTHAFFLMGHAPNEQMLNIQNAVPEIILLPALIFRLWDDLGTPKEEKEMGYDASYVECYMKEHHASEETARDAASNLISEAWKKMNQFTGCPRGLAPFPTAFVGCSLNMARLGSVLYRSARDGPAKQGTIKDCVRKMLRESIPHVVI